MRGAGLAFVVDAVVTVLVTLRTRPKPVEELQGLVYGMANTEGAQSRTPQILGGAVLLGATILTIVFW
jgi:SSS family solute:Na+ symporter